LTSALTASSDNPVVIADARATRRGDARDDDRTPTGAAIAQILEGAR
jgi:hypothetical protein